jgi:hypothetical protein
MLDLTSVPNFEDLKVFIKERVDAMHVPVQQWADLARLAVQGLPYDTHQLARLESLINTIRAELRSVVIVASEHFSDEQLNRLRKDVGMSKYAWRTLKKRQAVTIKNGFSLVIY